LPQKERAMKFCAFYTWGWWTIPENLVPTDRNTLITYIRYADPQARFYVHDFYTGYRGDISRHRLLKDPYRAQKEIAVLFSSDAAEEHAIVYLDTRKVDLDFSCLEGGNIHNAARAERLRKAILDFYKPPAPRSAEPVVATGGVATEAIKPITPLKPAVGSLLPQMPIPDHCKR
jgi:hypothetical protein